MVGIDGGANVNGIENTLGVEMPHGGGGGGGGGDSLNPLQFGAHLAEHLGEGALARYGLKKIGVNVDELPGKVLDGVKNIGGDIGNAAKGAGKGLLNDLKPSNWWNDVKPSGTTSPIGGDPSGELNKGSVLDKIGKAVEGGVEGGLESGIE